MISAKQKKCSHVSTLCERVGKECVTKFSSCEEFGKIRADWNVNQLAKWTYWNNQQVTAIETAPSNLQYAWKVPSEMKLDCDKRDGEGPETVTFQSVPAGAYQVLVHKHKMDKPIKLRDANASVRFVLPGTEKDIQVTCIMKPGCKASSKRFWRAAIIEVKPKGKQYTVHLHAGESMWKKFPMDIDALPTFGKPWEGGVNFWDTPQPMFRQISAGKGYWGSYDKSKQIVGDLPIRSDHQKLGKTHFQNTCVSECTIATPGIGQKYKKCLTHN